MVATAVLLDLGTARRTRFGSHSFHRLRINLAVLVWVFATTTVVDRARAVETHLAVAIGTGDVLADGGGSWVLVLDLAILDGKAAITLDVQAGHVVLADPHAVLHEGDIPAGTQSVFMVVQARCKHDAPRRASVR